MQTILQKLNYKNQKSLVVLQAPKTFVPTLSELPENATVFLDLENITEIEFALVFVTLKSQVDALVPLLASKLKGDAVFWMAYPKKSSKKYTCDINRDIGWSIMGRFDLEGVRLVAIDEDWSAMRFRKVDYIKAITRKFKTLSHKGRIKAGQTN